MAYIEHTKKNRFRSKAISIMLGREIVTNTPVHKNKVIISYKFYNVLLRCQSGTQILAIQNFSKYFLFIQWKNI